MRSRLDSMACTTRLMRSQRHCSSSLIARPPARTEAVDMKGLLVLVFIALAVFAGWQYKLNRDLNDKVGLLTLQLNAFALPKALPPRPTATPIPRIVCPACHGERTIAYDPTGSNNPLNRIFQTCPVCLGRGFRELSIPAGMQSCPDCRGMGIVYSPVDGRHPISAGNCPRCGATGLVALIK